MFFVKFPSYVQGIHCSLHNFGVVGIDGVNEEAAFSVEILTLTRSALATSGNVLLLLN
jgi:hypothetical protein